MFDYDLRPVIVFLLAVGVVVGIGATFLVMWLWNHVAVVVQ